MSCGELAGELRCLADKVFPDLEEKAREVLALHKYLDKLDNPANSIFCEAKAA